MNGLAKLLSIASVPFTPLCNSSSCLSNNRGRAYNEVATMLASRNGFTAFESALVVFPTVDTSMLVGLDAWNDMNGWRRHYSGCIPDSMVLFAEDLFACQFGVLGHGIIRFEPETGICIDYADSLEQWAERLLANYAEDTGWPLAHEWQVLHGPLPAGSRLLPKQPFVLGGDFVVENLRVVEAGLAMEKLGALFGVIRNVPDGEHVTANGWLD